MTATGLIPRPRLRWIPKDLRLAHEYCFWLHDQAVRLLGEYEAAEAHLVQVKFRSRVQADRFAELSAEDPTEALRATGYPKQARRVVLNTITMAMVSDCLHHLYEALRCFEKRKVVVALNLMRKPFLESLPYLSWMLAEEDRFYSTFMQSSPHGLTQKSLGNFRSPVLRKALSMTTAHDALDADFITAMLFDPAQSGGLYPLFQHAAHLITVQRIELQTTAKNFNFIFKRYSDNDLYEAVYDVLPFLILMLTSVIFELFHRIKPMDGGAKSAFAARSLMGLHLVDDPSNVRALVPPLSEAIRSFRCKACSEAFAMTQHNAARLVLSDSLRCTRCGTVAPIPFSWIV